jgi:hypothetical protein
MSRIPARLRISVKDNVSGENHKIEFVVPPYPCKRFWIRFNGKYSKKADEMHLTEFNRRLNILIRSMLKNCF